MDKNYETLEQNVFNIRLLGEKELEFLKRMQQLFLKNPDWNEFSNTWMQEGRTVWGALPKKKIVELPVYNICLDLEMRLAIAQGQARAPDIRDAVEAIIDRNFRSRYQFCKQAQISQDALSRVLNKRRNPSLLMLSDILDSLGYELSLKKKKTDGAVRDAKSTKPRRQEQSTA